jgi:hypothetical protein
MDLDEKRGSVIINPKHLTATRRKTGAELTI